MLQASQRSTYLINKLNHCQYIRSTFLRYSHDINPFVKAVLRGVPIGWCGDMCCRTLRCSVVGIVCGLLGGAWRPHGIEVSQRSVGLLPTRLIWRAGRGRFESEFLGSGQGRYHGVSDVDEKHGTKKFFRKTIYEHNSYISTEYPARGSIPGGTDCTHHGYRCQVWVGVGHVRKYGYRDHLS